MKEYHGEKRYKDYLLKRYSISREGVTDLKIDALKFAVLYHYDIWDSVHQLRLKDGDPGNLKATNIITKR